MVERREQYVGADRHPSGACSDCSHRGHHRCQVPVLREVMLCQPNRIEPGLIRVCDLLEQRGIELRGVELRQLGRLAEIQKVTELYCCRHRCRLRFLSQTRFSASLQPGSTSTS